MDSPEIKENDKVLGPVVTNTEIASRIVVANQLSLQFDDFPENMIFIKGPGTRILGYRVRVFPNEDPNTESMYDTGTGVLRFSPHGLTGHDDPGRL